MKTLTELEKGIMENFDIEFPSPDGRDFIGMERISSIKSFISSALAQHREKIVEEIRGMRNDKEHICRFNDGEQNCDCFNAGLEEVIKKLENHESR